MKRILQTIGQKTCPRCGDGKLLITVSWKKYKDGRIMDAAKQTTACGICRYSEWGPLSPEQLGIARAIVEKDERPSLADQFAEERAKRQVGPATEYRDPSAPTERPDDDIDVSKIPF
jgi:ribosomal protein S27AE